METPFKSETAVARQRSVARWVESGSTIEALGGAAAIVLAIMGLAEVAPGTMMAIAAIVLGGALFLQGGLVAAEYNEILSRFEGPYAEFGGGLGAEALAGVSSMVLGILALFGVEPMTLLAVATIVLGAGLALSSGVANRLNSVKIELSKGSAEAKAVAHEAVSGAALTQIFVGLAAVILGVLALINISPAVMVLVAILGVGVSTVLSGGALITRMWALLSR